MTDNEDTVEEEEREDKPVLGSRILGTVIQRVKSKFDNRITGTR